MFPLAISSALKALIVIHCALMEVDHSFGEQYMSSSQVALKALIIIHRALREVDHSFCEELIYHNNHRGHLLNSLHFKDDSDPTGIPHSST